MRFRITKHSAVKPPEDVLSRLLERIPQRREDVIFTIVGNEIRARVDRDDASSRTHDERAEIGREAVLEAVSDVCERWPGLKADWFAVSPTA
jgi:hypothetical protein